MTDSNTNVNSDDGSSILTIDVITNIRYTGKSFPRQLNIYVLRLTKNTCLADTHGIIKIVDISPLFLTFDNSYYTSEVCVETDPVDVRSAN